MRVELQTPASWALIVGDEDRTTWETAPGCTITIGALEPWPDDVEAWARELLAADAPVGARLEIAGDAHLASTRSGWPLRVVGADLHAADGSVEERRVVALIRFLEHGAALVLRSRDPAVDPLDAAMLAAIASCEPDWSGEIRAVAELFEGFVSAPDGDDPAGDPRR